MQSVGERFWAKVDFSDDGCWEWRGCRSWWGYGLFRLDGKMAAAHRVAYQRVIGAIPEGLEIDHICERRACVRPDHLRPLTHRENMCRSQTAPSAINARKTHCVHGHEFTVATTRVHDGRRICRTCRNISARDRRVAVNAT